MTPEDELQQVLLRRSAELAKPRATEMAPESLPDQLRYLEVCLTPEWYGIPLSFISSVSRLADYTLLPGLPPYIAGIASHRGRVFTLLDLRKFLGIPSPGITQLDILLVLEHESRLLGLLVDELGVVNSVSKAGLQKTSASASSHVLGLTSERVSIISPEHLFRLENYPGINFSAGTEP